MASPASLSAPLPSPAVSGSTTSAISSPSTKPIPFTVASAAAPTFAPIGAPPVAPAVAPVAAPAASIVPATSSPIIPAASGPAIAALGPCVLYKYSTCTAPDTEEVQQCQRDICTKAIHRSCSLHVTEPFRDPAAPFHVVCGKRCYNQIEKYGKIGEAAVTSPVEPIVPEQLLSIGRKKRAVYHEKEAPTKRLSWDKDGPSDDVNSLSVLLAWLSEPKNYARWVNGGDESKPETKKSLADEILELMKARGITYERNRSDVSTKIYTIEKSFADAAQWVATNEATLDDEALAAGAIQRCKYYAELVDSMGVHPHKPVARGRGRPAGQSTGKPRGRPAGQSTGKPRGRPASTSTGKPRGRPAGQSTGKTRGRSASAPASKPRGRQATKRSAPVEFDADTGAAIKHRRVGRPRKDSAPARRGAPKKNKRTAANDLRAAVEAHVTAAALSGATNALDTLSLSAISATGEHYALLQSVAEKLQADANTAAVAASTALLRARKAMRDEGVPQDEIDAALPIARQV